MLWLIEYDDGFAKGFDTVQGNSVLEAKRNLIAKVGGDNIRFVEVKRYA